MQAGRVDGLDAYIERLHQDRREVEQLFQDLLISVTHFFRDKAAFDALANVIPDLFHNKGADASVRVWVPGCASGEEAYAIAILLREHMARFEVSAPVQIFATDIDESALDIARQGRYGEGIAEHISVERLARFFTKAGHSYQVAKAIRDLCIFSTHNLISDLALCAAGPDRLPQPADLPRRRCAAQARTPAALCAGLTGLSVPRLLREHRDTSGAVPDSR